MIASDFADRRERIRLPLVEIGRRITRHQETVRFALRGDKRLPVAIHEQVCAAILAEERALLAHLLALHPDLAIAPGTSSRAGATTGSAALPGGGADLPVENAA